MDNEHETRISLLEQRMGRLEASHESFRQDNKKEHESILNALTKLADKLSNRLPLWATMGFGLLLAVIGWLAK